MPTFIPDPIGWSIVVAGQWNRAIFTPKWISGRLTQEQKLNLEIAVNNPSAPIRISFDNVILTVTSRRLQVSVERCEDVFMQKAQQVVQKVLQDLNHTPISGLGINFRFLCDAPSGKLLNTFDVRDLHELSDVGLSIQSTKISRVLKRENQTINLSLEFEAGKAVVAFNFHSSAKTAEQALASLNEDVIALKDTTIKILTDVYEGDF